MKNQKSKIKNLGKILPLLFLVVVLAGCEQMPFAPGGRYPGASLPPSTACYALEPGVTAKVDISRLRDRASCTSQFEGKTYVRLRQEVKIPSGKIREGQGAHPGGDCQDSYYGSLREVGFTTDGRRVFWESLNYKKEDLKDFILIFKKEEGRYHHFDVYIDETKDVPDFVKNCEETGGLIPVVDEGNMLPPQVFAIGGMPVADPAIASDCTGEVYDCLGEGDRKEPGFSANQADFKPYYIQISQIDECPFETSRPPNVPKCPGDRAVEIGELTASGGGDTKTYTVYYHADTMYLWDGTDEGEVFVYNPTDEPPPKPTGRQPTLQLKALKFISTAIWTWATPECKPVIYLYPEKATKLSVELDPAGYLTESEPAYKEGWQDLVAYPGGRIVHQGKEYDSLYYEAVIEKFKTPQKGWVVKKDMLGEFFDEILPQVGLNEKEAAELREYWVGRLTKSPYYFIGLLSGEEIERIEPIEFSVKPDTFIRVRFYFKDVPAPFKVEPPALPTPPLRVGFTVVEWGGLYKN